MSEEPDEWLTIREFSQRHPNISIWLIGGWCGGSNYPMSAWGGGSFFLRTRSRCWPRANRKSGLPADVDGDECCNS